jgi:hypothetical protein
MDPRFHCDGHDRAAAFLAVGAPMINDKYMLTNDIHQLTLKTWQT